MDDVPRRELQQLFQNYGETIYDDPVRTEGLLLDYCGSDYRVEAASLTMVLRSKVAGELRQLSGKSLSEGTLTEMVRKMGRLPGVNEEKARWAILCWAEISGVNVPSRRVAVPGGRGEDKPGTAGVGPTVALILVVIIISGALALRSHTGHDGNGNSVSTPAPSPSGEGQEATATAAAAVAERTAETQRLQQVAEVKAREDAEERQRLAQQEERRKQAVAAEAQEQARQAAAQAESARQEAARTSARQSKEPGRFKWNYAGVEQPGPRFWTRSGTVWTEKYPSGYTKTYRTLRSATVSFASGKFSAALRGTIVQLEAIVGVAPRNLPQIVIFIPDKGSEHMWLLAQAGQAWVLIGVMQDVH